MTRAWPLLAAALFHPLPVEEVGVNFNADGSLDLSWTLPADPTVVGLTIYRDNLDNGDTTIFKIIGLTTDYTDTSIDHDDSYRYWIHTRDAEGDLSDGVYVEIFADGGHGRWTCSEAAAGSGPLPTWPCAAAAFLLLIFRRRQPLA